MREVVKSSFTALRRERKADSHKGPFPTELNRNEEKELSSLKSKCKEGREHRQLTLIARLCNELGAVQLLYSAHCVTAWLGVCCSRAVWLAFEFWF